MRCSTTWTCRLKNAARCSAVWLTTSILRRWTGRWTACVKIASLFRCASRRWPAPGRTGSMALTWPAPGRCWDAMQAMMAYYRWAGCRRRCLGWWSGAMKRSRTSCRKITSKWKRISLRPTAPDLSPAGSPVKPVNRGRMKRAVCSNAHWPSMWWRVFRASRRSSLLTVISAKMRWRRCPFPYPACRSRPLNVTGWVRRRCWIPASGFTKPTNWLPIPVRTAAICLKSILPVVMRC